ncbi:uncharacterized protein An02g05900 [Aspergillus niger]|uniref:Contig An02c0170, genomic contig n=2 Tax=Aspergillus niger TaxID=5061 RepID=A2QD56_ASPNC|nr:uncharacterized protein An02g05900 [Aspergillus niger]CAK44205.1 unnamed protein product [Aspergillus niger]
MVLRTASGTTTYYCCHTLPLTRIQDPASTTPPFTSTASPPAWLLSSKFPPFGPKATPRLWLPDSSTYSLGTFSATIAGTFGVAAGTFALFFFGEIPRVRRDILQKVPFLDEYFDRTIAPEDNPF